ncbi:MAG TPA: hypothetical protein VN700_14255 [Vicinamibacterales bacterium]|nr:hypothetical protein [Vicinamibacterales bacterium]
MMAMKARALLAMLALAAPAYVAAVGRPFRAGPAWTAQKSNVTARLRGVSAVSEKVAWASGSGNTILRTEDGGETWTKITSPTTDRLDFRDIDAVGERAAYVLSIGAGSTSRIYKTVDAGQTWALQFTNEDPDAFFDAMAFWDAERGIAVSDSVKGAFVIITTDNGGKTWTRVPATSLPPALPNEGAFAASGTNVAVLGNNVWFGTGAAARSRVLHSTDRGKTWTIAETPMASGQSSGIYSVAFRDAQHGVIVGGDYSKEQEAVDNAAVTSDGGRTWTLVKGLHGFRSVVAHVPGSRSSFVALGPQGSDISTDDGKTWIAIEGPGFDTFSFVTGKTIGWGSGARGSIGRLDGLK